MKPTTFKILRAQVRGFRNALNESLKYTPIAYLVGRFIYHRKLFVETEENKNDRTGFMSGGGGLATIPELKAQKLMLKAWVEGFQLVLDSHDKNKPLIWVDWPVPVEIVKAFDVAVFSPSYFMFGSQSKGGISVVNHLAATEEDGITSDMCTMNRISLGAYLSDQVPKPSAIISISHPCDAGRAANEMYGYLSDVPMYTIDTVYDRDEESLEYFGKSVMGAISFLEEHLGKKIDWDKLKLLGDELNKSNYYFKEVTAMHRNVPAPGLINYLISGCWLSNIWCAGNPDFTASAKKYYDIAKFRVKHPHITRLYRKKEKFRVMIGDMYLIFAEIIIWMRKEFGANVVSDYVGDRINPQIDTSTKESLVRGIAADKLYMGMIRQAHVPIETTIDEMLYKIDAYSVDCLIFFGNQLCKHNRSIDTIVKRTLKKKGIPVLFLDADIYDQRVMPESEIKIEVEKFFMANGFIS